MSGRILALVGGHGQAPPSTPEAAAKLVGALLRHLRDEKKLDQREVVEAVPEFNSISTLSRYENAKTPLKPENVNALLRFYRASEDVFEDAEALLQWRAEQRWWSAFSDVADHTLTSLFALESTSKVVQVYQENNVPGMLQTAGYARALMDDYAKVQFDPEKRREAYAAIERRLQMRMRRQHLLDQPHAPVFRALVAECVLDKQLGGVMVMREQLRSLLNVAENKPDVHIRILPGSALRTGSPLHPAITLFKPHEGAENRSVYLENKNVSGELLTDVAQIETFMASMDYWWQQALPKSATMERIQHYIDKLANEASE
ncbi:helix-turn-helix transcriptional regulator [Streptomyces sp. Pv4-95]|uniref:helix-turn-helix domain-containing protein n=1 Tax=Streptomyces sp. Pv4-95 TaxID=3049543 RepID=UPI003892AD43